MDFVSGDAGGKEVTFSNRGDRQAAYDVGNVEIGVFDVVSADFSSRQLLG